MSEVPSGWRIEPEWDVGIAIVDGDWRYVAYRWGTWTQKRLFRKPVERSGWIRAGYSSKHRSETVRWIEDTVRAMEGAGNDKSG
jgi:hypothetical protein